MPKRITNIPYFITILTALILLAGCQQQTPAGELAAGIVKIAVDRDGLYKITADDLSQAGLDIETLSADQLSLRYSDTAVPFIIADNTLIFYGIAPDSRYTTVRTYWLESGKPGQTMTETAVTATGSPQPTVTLTARREENKLYEPRARKDDTTELWFWDTINHEQKLDIDLELPIIADGSGQLRIALWGFTQNFMQDPDHDLDVLVNGRSLGTIQWDGETHYTAVLDMPPGTLINGRNTITLDNTPPSASVPDIMRLNWIEVDYTAPATAVNDRITIHQPAKTITLNGFSAPPHLFDITDPWQPIHLTNDQPMPTLDTPAALIAAGPRGLLTPAAITPVRQSQWHTPENNANLIILTTDELAPALEPLAEARRAQGLAVAIVPVEEIYDAFGDGSPTPDTIHAFLAYAAANWQTPPHYLHIVGDATSDYKNYLGNQPANIVPAPMVTVQFGGETVSDSRLVDFDGDAVPDMAVGRWPVQTKAEVEQLVSRTLAYEQGTAVPRAIFTADASEPYFNQLAGQIAASANIPQDQTTILNGPTPDQIAAEWQQGVWLTTYIGHGSVQQWGKDNLLTTADADILQAPNPPIVVQLTCLTGLFADPNVPSLSETLLTSKNGPVLIVAATSLTLSDNQEPFALALLKNLQDPSVQRMGDAFQNAKHALDITNEGLREISDTFMLMGDPAALIVRPENNS